MTAYVVTTNSIEPQAFSGILPLVLTANENSSPFFGQKLFAKRLSTESAFVEVST